MLTPKTLQEAFSFFYEPQNCIAYMAQKRWPDGIVRCPTCDSAAVTWMPTRSLFQCKGKHAKRQFSVKVGTIFEDSPIALGKWLLVAWMLGACRNGISSYEVARTIGITQKSAWFMLHRLRYAMQENGVVLHGEIEADETYIGGRIKNKHRSTRRQGFNKDKTPVFGMVERGGRVMAQVMPDAKAASVLPVIASAASPDAILHTDDYPIYDGVAKVGLQHQRINHRQDFFVRGSVHTNTIENFWSCLKRMLGGTYIAVRPKHLAAYVNEQVFRFNHRRYYTEQERFGRVLEGVPGKRLTYKSLIGRA